MLRHRRTGILALVLLAGLLASLAAPAVHAQNLSFNLRENRVSLFIEKDGTVLVVYDMTFVAEPGSAPIDYVDIGLPNNSYRLGEVRAKVGEVAVVDITDSPYVKPGIAFGLGEGTIRPGQTGTLHAEIPLRKVIYPDSKDKEYASIEFAPHYYDSSVVHGTTRLEVNFYFPMGVTAEEPRYHKVPFTSAGFEFDRAVYTWIDEGASGSRQYVFGASFPKKYLDEGVVQQPPAFRLNLGSICSSPFLWIGGFIAAWIGLGLLGARTQKRRKMEYLPPSLAVEGTGIKRGLSAVEAALLLEAPLNKVMSMILFGMLKKGFLVVESEKPLRVKAVEPQPDDAQLWYYERRFLKAIRPDGSLAEKDLHEMVLDLIGDVNKKLAGFSRKETKAYYKDIAARAWQQVEAADTPEVLGERWSDGLEWTMLDDDWDRRTRRTFEDRPVMLPGWWWGYRPWIGRPGMPSAPSAPVPAPAGGGTPITLPTLPGADFANTVVSGVENAANTVVTSIERFTGNVTEKTNPPPKTSSSSSGRSYGGGRSCACACACACAGCACACAGGGR